MNFSYIEFIVTFDGYYNNKKRHSIVVDALKHFKGNTWKEVERSNPASDFPSDFTVLQVG